jgi:Tfp pilus assembly protein PilF
LVSHLPNFYDANVALLKDHHPQIWHRITVNPPEPAGEILMAPGEKPNLKIMTTSGQVGCLHPYDDPEMEMKPFLDMVPEVSTGVVTFLGFGLGYSPLQLVQNRPHVRHFVVFELNPGVFVRALHLVDLAPLLSDKRVTLSVGPKPDISEVFTPAKRALQLESAHLLQHPPSFAADSEGYVRLRDQVYEYINKLNVSGATSARYGRDFVSNRFRQLTSLPHNHYLLEQLQDIFTNVPAILVAAGPSLDKNIHLLPRAKDKALIIAVDTALPALCRHGVLPDFLTAIDPEALTYEKFADVVPQAQGVSLITFPGVTIRVPKIFPAAGIFWLFSGKPMEAWMNTLLGGKILTGGAGTVAHASILSAVILKCSPIVLVGQDLAYPTDKSHAQYTVLSDKGAMKAAQLSDVNAMWVEGVNGDKVRTHRAFLSDKEYFERIVAENDNHYINATQGGAHIKGTEIMDLERVLERFCQEDQDISSRLGAFLNNARSIDPAPILTEFRAAQKKVSEVTQVIRHADTLAHEAKKSLRRLLNRNIRITSLAALPATLQSKLSRIDAHHTRLDGETFLWLLVEELTLEGLRQKERVQHELSQLENRPDKYLEWLLRSLDMREQINIVRQDILSFLDRHLALVVNHYTKEQRLQAAIAKGAKKPDRLLELAELYFQSEDLVLAQKILEELLAVAPQTARAHLGLGEIALFQADFQKAEEHFRMATELGPAMVNAIEAVRQRIARQYLGFAEQYVQLDRGTARRLLLKGLKYCPYDDLLRQRLALLAEKALAIIHAAAENEPDEARDLVEDWHCAFEENVILSSSLSPETVTEFYRQYAMLLIEKQDYAGAIECLQAALAVMPVRPDLHLSIADVLFAMGDYATGITHLQKAVAYDRNYAQFWENMGDNLRQRGQLDDAIAAYEQCFLALPENLVLLRKIGECYLALDQPEVAREVYLQLKGCLRRVSCGQPG